MLDWLLIQIKRKLQELNEHRLNAEYSELYKSVAISITRIIGILPTLLVFLQFFGLADYGNDNVKIVDVASSCSVLFPYCEMECTSPSFQQLNADRNPQMLSFASSLGFCTTLLAVAIGYHLGLFFFFFSPTFRWKHVHHLHSVTLVNCVIFLLNFIEVEILPNTCFQCGRSCFSQPHSSSVMCMPQTVWVLCFHTLDFPLLPY